MPNTPIVLIRGLFREKRHWGNFPTYLQSVFPNRQIITMNVAGAGDRNHLDSPNNISEMVDDFRSQLSSLYPNINTFDLIGLSMGGMITLDWCSRFPNEIHKAILINTSTRSLSGFHERLRWQQYGNILKSTVRTIEQKERFSYTLCSNNPVNEETLRDWVSWAISNPMSNKSSFNQLIACMNYKIDAKPEVPMLILASNKDKMVSPECSFKLARHWGLPIFKHPSAGHDIPIDDPSWVCEKAKLFLATKEKELA